MQKWWQVLIMMLIALNWNLPLLLTTLQSKQLENTKIHLRQERVFLKYYSTLFL